MAPQVSIIIPVHNAERYLEQCLDSVLAQTFGDFEVLCVDDASTDGSLALLRDYENKDDRFTIIEGAFNGPSATRNAALNIAQGAYIAFLDADDWWDASLLETVIQRAEEANAQLVVFDYWLYREGEPRSTYRDQALFNRLDGQVVNLATCPELAGFVGIWDRLFRRDVLVPHGFMEGLLYEDAVYCIESLLKADRVAIMANHLYWYRRNVQASITYTEDASRKHEEDFLIAQSYIQDCLTAANVSTAAWESYARYFAEYAYMHQREVTPYKRFKAFFNEVRKQACKPSHPQLFELAKNDPNPWRRAYLASVQANTPKVAWTESKALNQIGTILGRR